MLIADAQREMRLVFAGGSVGQAVSGTLWLISAGLGTWVSPRAAILFLILAGVFIFPLTQLVFKLLGRQASARKENPLNGLAMQVAFIAPLMIPLVLAATGYNQAWFYPAFMIAIGAHYLPFIFLYGMWQFGVLAGVLLGAGALLGMLMPQSFVPGGWITGLALWAFALWVRRVQN